MDKLGLCKTGHDFISKTDGPYNQSGQFAEADFIYILAYFLIIVRVMYKKERNI